MQTYRYIRKESEMDFREATGRMRENKWWINAFFKSTNKSED